MEQNNSPESQNPSTSPAAQTPPENPPMQRKSKVILWILASLVIIVLLGSFIYGFVTGIKNSKTELTPSPTPIPSPSSISPVPDIKTYEGSDFSFTYSTEDFNENLVDPNNLGLSGRGSFMQISISTEKNESSNQILYNTNCQKYGSAITFQDLPACKLYYFNGHARGSLEFDTDDPNAILIVVPENNKSYIFTMVTERESLRENESKFDQILSTFKFTTKNNNPLSKEEESCGPNAGSAGNAECEAGLTCVYATQQDMQSGIGTCKASN